MSIAVGEIDGVTYRKTARNAPTLLIEIETDRAGTWSLMEEAITGTYPLGGKRVLHRQQLVIYEHELPGVKALVRTDEHERMWADALASAPQTVREKDQTSLGAQLAAAKSKLALAESKGRGVSQAASEVSQAENQIAREANRLLCLKPGMKDGLPPLTSAKVIKAGPPPETPANLAANGNDRLAATLERLLDAREAKARTKG